VVVGVGVVLGVTVGFSMLLIVMRCVRRYALFFHCSTRTQYVQELSYRKQIARQLRTKYVEGIYRHKYYTVTLKYRLGVIRCHWKQNHWIDHTRLSSCRVI